MIKRRLIPVLAAMAFGAFAQTTPNVAYKAHAVTTPDGVRLNVQEWGNPNGPEILFIHGAFQSYLSWTKQFKSDLAKDFRLVTYDSRGHGFSDKPTAPEYYKESKRWADEVNAVIVQTGLKRPVLVGWSYAGRIMSDYLMTYGEKAISGVNFVGALTNSGLNAKTPALPAMIGMTSEDQGLNIESTRAFLRYCFSRQPTEQEFETMVGINMLTPTFVRRHLGGAGHAVRTHSKGA